MLTKLETIKFRLSEVWEREGAKGVFSTAWTRTGGMKGIFSAIWSRFWMLFAGSSFFGRIATRIATWSTPPFYGRYYLARLYSKGYIAVSATIHHADLRLGANVCINDRVIIYQDTDGGSIELGGRVFIHCGVILQTGSGGNIAVGEDAQIHPNCMLSAYKASIRIGSRVLIAPNCGIYPYDHGHGPDEIIRRQPFQTKGDIVIDDDSWLGFGVILLSGVRIGKGAVIGAGAVVIHDIPDGAIAVGVPARVVKMRSDLSKETSTQKYEVNSNDHTNPLG